MVDFRKRLSNKKVEAVVDPMKLYDTLDRAHDKGPLRPAQVAVLEEWFSKFREQKDVIVKLHTGQGKTLVGLLMLQSRLNEKKGPVLYLCPNNFLVEQTCEQARQFGISTCIADPDLPEDFLAGRKILVTSVHKLFNGLTRFGLYKKSIPVDTVLLDDAHACSDIIREACHFRVPREDPAYDALKTLFAEDIEQQGKGTYADINNHKYDAFLPIPYWTWMEHESEVAAILSAGTDRAPIKFAWPILKDMLGHCQCILSGEAIEIEPYVPPLNAMGTYWEAPHRIFMSATVTDDAFLVKGMQLSPETIKNPLIYEKERWSGEKMILIPSLIREELDRSKIVYLFGNPNNKRRYGVVALAPSFHGTRDWEGYNSLIAQKGTVGDALDKLQKGDFFQTVVLVNRYDGIDLPDDTCRILILDTKPYSENLIDWCQEACRPNSEATIMRTVRTIEQGLGRSVRGEKDYSVIVITGADLTRLICTGDSRKYLSTQMAKQIEIGFEIAEMASQDIKAEKAPEAVLDSLINQCLSREPDWKAFYAQQMDTVKPSGPNEHVLQLYAVELAAEQKFLRGDYEGAVSTLQQLLDKNLIRVDDRGWYLQEMARYNYRFRRPESQKLQIAAYNNNHRLLRPPVGVTIAKITTVSQDRMERIIAWVKQYTDYRELNAVLSDILDRLAFGVKADKFEDALDELGRALGFVSERPDKKWKEGPDNLWALDDTRYILWECKSEVDVKRVEINKGEASQMNSSCAWFGKHYNGCKSKNIIIHPSSYAPSQTAFTHDVEVMRQQEIKRLREVVRVFYKSFESQNFRNLSPINVQQLIDAHNLSIDAILSSYTKRIRDK